MASPLPDGDVSRAPTLIGVFVTMTSIAMLCLAARLYTRFRILKKPGADDLVLTVNMVNSSISGIMINRS